MAELSSPPPEAREEAERRSSDVEPAQSIREETTTALEAEGEGPLQVTVLDDLGKPLVGAEVAAYWLVGNRPRVADWEAAAWEGPVWRSGPGGRVDLPMPPRPQQVVIFARASGVWGQAALRSFSEEPRLTVVLKNDLSLSVQVQDDLGRPVTGVSVRVSLREDAGTIFGFLYGTSAGEGGVVHFEHIQERFPEDFDGAAVVQLAAPSVDALAVEVDLLPPPLEPVVIRLPEVGGLRLRMVDAQGVPVGERSENLTIGDFLEPSVVRLDYRGADGVVREFPLSFTGDAVEIFPVGTGVEFQLSVESVLMRGATEWLSGPSHAGHWVEQDVEVDLLPVLAGRLIDSAGQPLAGYWHATGMRAGHGTYNQYFETQADGTFLIPYPAIEEGVREQLSVVFRPSRADRSEPTAFIDGGTHRWHAGVNELGEVRMGRASLLASGQVLDVAGQPAAGVAVSVLHGTWGGDLYSASWIPAATSDADGRFELRGAFPHAEAIILAAGGQPLESARVGMRDLVLRLPQ